MHINNLKQYYFIKTFDQNNLSNLPNNVVLIYRNYVKPTDINTIKIIRDFCKKKKLKFYISNDFKLALKLGLDGVYLPSFNKDYYHNCYSYNRKFDVVGSAHNIHEIKIKIKQNVSKIFIAPTFKKKRGKIYGLYNFVKIKSFSTKNLIALGGINNKNIKRLIMFNAFGFAAINYFKKKGPYKRGL